MVDVDGAMATMTASPSWAQYPGMEMVHGAEAVRALYSQLQGDAFSKFCVGGPTRIARTSSSRCESEKCCLTEIGSSGATSSCSISRTDSSAARSATTRSRSTACDRPHRKSCRRAPFRAVVRGFRRRSRPSVRGCSAASLPPPDPHRRVCRLDSPVDDLEQLPSHRLQVDGVSESTRECRDGRIRVIAGSVESAVDHSLDPHA